MTCLGNQLGCSEHRTSPTDVEFLAPQEAQYALSLERFPGRIWEVILGHCKLLGLQERGNLSTFFNHFPVHPEKTTAPGVPLWIRRT